MQGVMLAVDQAVGMLMLLPMPSERDHVCQIDGDAKLLPDLAGSFFETLAKAHVAGRRGVESERPDVFAGRAVLEQDLRLLGRAASSDPAEECQVPVTITVDVAPSPRLACWTPLGVVHLEKLARAAELNG